MNDLFFKKICLTVVVLLISLVHRNVLAASCDKSIYLTFDTGNMAVAQDVARILRDQDVKATFFLANEKTFRHDYALDDSWKIFWNTIVKDGHQIGSHTYNHTYWIRDIGHDKVLVKPQFGPSAGKKLELSNTQFCRELQLVDDQFKRLTGSSLSKIWRAPGGKTSARLIEFGKVCGFTHIAWSPAGFLGDELPSEQFSNPTLLKKALQL
jgi:peptidoglycan/xylan/chitin deacetylase (PgdA/CDA1 family)